MVKPQQEQEKQERTSHTAIHTKKRCFCSYSCSLVIEKSRFQTIRTTTGAGRPAKTPTGRADRLKQPRVLGWFSVRPVGKRSLQPGAPECAFPAKKNNQGFQLLDCLASLTALTVMSKLFCKEKVVQLFKAL